VFAGNVEVNGRVVIDDFFSKDGIELFFIIFCKKNIVKSQFFKRFFDAPIKNNTLT